MRSRYKIKFFLPAKRHTRKFRISEFDKINLKRKFQKKTQDGTDKKKIKFVFKGEPFLVASNEKVPKMAAKSY